MMGFWGDSGRGQTIRKQSAPHSRQTTMPTNYHLSLTAWSMKQRVPDQEVDQRGPGERLWKRTVKHVNLSLNFHWPDGFPDTQSAESIIISTESNNNIQKPFLNPNQLLTDRTTHISTLGTTVVDNTVKKHLILQTVTITLDNVYWLAGWCSG